MGTISKRTTTKGDVRYRALIQVRKQGVNFSESKTFSKKTLAEAWIKKREAEIEINPEILQGCEIKQSMTLYDAIERYIQDVTEIGQSKLYKLKQFKTYDFAKLQLINLTRDVFSAYALKRRNSNFDGGPVAKSTVEQDLYYFKSVLMHAEFVLNQDSPALFELEKAMVGLRNAKQIDRSENRERLPTREELLILTSYFSLLKRIRDHRERIVKYDIKPILHK